MRKVINRMVYDTNSDNVKVIMKMIYPKPFWWMRLILPIGWHKETFLYKTSNENYFFYETFYDSNEDITPVYNVKIFIERKYPEIYEEVFGEYKKA